MSEKSAKRTSDPGNPLRCRLPRTTLVTSFPCHRYSAFVDRDGQNNVRAVKLGVPIARDHGRWLPIVSKLTPPELDYLDGTFRSGGSGRNEVSVRHRQRTPRPPNDSYSY